MRKPPWDVTGAFGGRLDQLVELEAPAVALGALDAEHVELAFDIAEAEIGSGRGAADKQFDLCQCRVRLQDI
jgi:hypothetical protein